MNDSNTNPIPPTNPTPPRQPSQATVPPPPTNAPPQPQEASANNQPQATPANPAPAQPIFQASSATDKSKWSTELGGILKYASTCALVGGILVLVSAPIYIFGTLLVSLWGGAVGMVGAALGFGGAATLFMIQIWGIVIFFIAQMVLSAIILFKESSMIKNKSSKTLDAILKLSFIALTLSLGEAVLGTLHGWQLDPLGIVSLIWGILSPLIYYVVGSSVIIAYFARSERAELWFGQNLTYNSRYWGIIKSLPDFVWKPRPGQTAPEATAEPSLKSFIIKVSTIYGIALVIAFGLGLGLRYTVYADLYRTGSYLDDLSGSIYDSSSSNSSSSSYDSSTETISFKADTDFTKNVEVGRHYLKVGQETIRLSDDIYFTIYDDTNLSGDKSMDLSNIFPEYGSTKYEKLSDRTPNDVILYDTYDHFTNSSEYHSYAFLKRYHGGVLSERSTGKITYYSADKPGAAGFFIKLNNGAVLDVYWYASDEDTPDTIKLWSEQFTI